MMIDFDVDMRQTVITMREAKRPLLEIADKVGVSVDALRRFCRANGLPLGLRGRPRKDPFTRSAARVW